MIDVRDLADWIIHCIEQKIVGVFNATGPEKELSMQGMMEGIRKGVASEVKLTWIDNEFLEPQKVGENQFPLYAAPRGETAGFHRCSIARALAKGLKFRPVADTARATLEWYKSLPAETQARVAPQFAVQTGEKGWLDRERELLEIFRKAKS